MSSAQEVPSAASLLDVDTSRPLQIPRSLWGFGGAHGGLALALIERGMRQVAGTGMLRSIQAQFRRPLRETFTIDVENQGQGRTVCWIGARATVSGTPAVTASAVFSPGGTGPVAVSHPMPTVPPPHDCPIAATSSDQTPPFLHHMELRPVGRARPYSGGQEPELIAWLRFAEDDTPVETSRLIVLMDALPPSYLAVLDRPAAIPTVTYAVSPGNGLADTASPWALVRGRTHVASDDGWIHERLDAWAPNGAYLGAGEQLRFVATNPQDRETETET